MKRLETSLLFKISLFLIINLLIKNIFILIITLIYLLIYNKKSLVIFIFLFVTLYISNNYHSDIIRYGVITETNDNYLIVDKLLYKVKVYNNSSLEVGDIVEFNNKSYYLKDDSKQKYNLRFTYYDELNKVSNLITLKYSNKQLNKFNDYTKSYLKKFILNENQYDVEIINVGYGLAFYYLLCIVNKKNKLATLILIIIYSLFFSFQYKFYLILIDLILYKISNNNLNNLLYKIIAISLININLLFNTSIIISLLFSFIYMSEFSKYKSFVLIIQSLLFNQIQPFNIYFYRYNIYLKIWLLILSIVTFIIPGIENIYLFIINKLDIIFNIINFSIRGKLSILSIIIFLLLINKIKIQNEIYRIIIIVCLLLLPTNNPIAHIKFINVGQGDSILIHSFLNQENILIDTGSIYNYSKLRNTLYGEGIYNIDYLIITHDDSDHSGNLDNLIRDFNIRNILTEPKDIEGKRYYLKSLYLGDFDNDNDNSLVYLLNIDNYQILLTGDISSKVESSIIKKHNIENVDILKVSHHGSASATSSYFVSKLLPKYAIISTSGMYNHPSEEVLNNLNKYAVEVYTTKLSGNITFYFTNIIDILITDIFEFVII